MKNLSIFIFLFLSAFLLSAQEITFVGCPNNFPETSSNWEIPVTIQNTSDQATPSKILYLVLLRENFTPVPIHTEYASVPVPTLNPGEDVNLTIIATLNNISLPNLYYRGTGGHGWLDVTDYILTFDQTTLENEATIDFYCKKYNTDLSIELIPNSNTYESDGIINYDVSVTNNGPEKAYNVLSVIGDTPNTAAPFTHYIQSTEINSGRIYRANGAVRWQIDELSVGETQTISLDNFINGEGNPLSNTDDVLINVSIDSGHLIDSDTNNNSKTSTVSFNDNTPCPSSIEGYTSLGTFDGNQYFISNASANWPTAQAAAESNNGYLASINNAEENEFIKNQLGNDIVLIGYNDAQSEGNFVWDSGETITYTNISGNNSDDDDYATMNFWAGSWEFVNAITAKKYILEIPCNVVGGELTISCPSNYQEQATIDEPSGKILNWPLPTATTTCSGQVTITQLAGPSSGSFINALNLPETVVYEISDECGNTETCSFEIAVSPLSTQTVCPADILVVATSAEGAVVTYDDMTLITSCTFNPSPTLLSGLASGSVFPIGTTEVLQGIFTGGSNTYCSNQEVCSFTVTVLPQSGEAVLEVADISCPEDFPQGFLSSNVSTTTLVYDVTITNSGNAASIPQVLFLYKEYFMYNSENVLEQQDLSLGSVGIPAIAPGESAIVSLPVEFNSTLSYSLPGLNFRCNSATRNTYLLINDGSAAPDIANSVGNINMFCKKYTTDLELELSTPDPTYGDDGIISYTVSITNNGNERAYNVYSILGNDIFRAGGFSEGCANNIGREINGSIGNISPTTHPNYINSAGGDLLRWNLQQLEVGETVTIDVNYYISNGGTPPSTFDLNLNVQSFHMFEDTNNLDPNTANNSDELVFTYVPDSNPCPMSIDGFTAIGEFDNHKYFISNNSANWPTAQAVAESHNGYLASINSVEENEFIKNQLGNEIVLIGYNDAQVEGNFVWDSGETPDYTNISGNNTANDDYATMNFWAGSWDFVNAITAKKYILEIPCSNTASANLEITNISCPTNYPRQGEPFIFDITITNQGTSASVEEQLFLLTRYSNGDTSPAPLISIPPIAPGASETFQYDLANSRFPGDVVGPPLGAVTSLGLLIGNPPSTATIDVFCRKYTTDIELNLTTDDATYGEDGLFNYTIVVSNNGNEDAYNLEIELLNDEIIDAASSSYESYGTPTIGSIESTAIVSSNPFATVTILRKWRIPFLAIGETAVLNVNGNLSVLSVIPDSRLVSKTVTSKHIIDPISENNSSAISFTKINNTICPDMLNGFTVLGEYNDSKYYISNTNETWESAQAISNDLNIGAYLASISSEEENNFIKNNISEIVHIGINDQETEGSFTWDSGETVNYTNFANCGFCGINDNQNDFGTMLNWDGAWGLVNQYVKKKFVIEVPCATTNSQARLSQATTIDANHSFIMGSYPNPAKDYITIQLYSTIEQESTLTIYNSQGKIQQQRDINLIEGINEFTINIHKLTSGMYFIHLPDIQSKKSKTRFIKARL